MAAGGIATLPAAPEDGGSGSFLPGAFKELKKLYCKNGGYFLRINADGRVDGTREKTDTHIKLQIQATSIGVVVIKGVSSSRYLAMNDDGRLFGTKRPTDECYFFERLEPNNYNTYRSREHPNWYVALKRTGQYKLGSRTGPGTFQGSSAIERPFAKPFLGKSGDLDSSTSEVILGAIARVAEAAGLCFRGALRFSDWVPPPVQHMEK